MTRIPAPLRTWLGRGLMGPPRGARVARGRICLFAPGMLGDMVICLSALRLLLAHFGTDRCVLVVTSPVVPLVARELPGVECIVLPEEASGLVRDILPLWRRERPKFAAERFAQTVCFSHQRSLYYEIALSWVDAGQDLRLTRETYPPALVDGWAAEIPAHQQLAALALGRPVSRAEIMPRLTSLQTSDDGRLLIYPLSREARRSIPVALAVDVLGAWSRVGRTPVVFGGSPAQRAQLERYAAAARSAGLVDVAVETPESVVGLLHHVAGARNLLACDSSAAHIGTTLDKPTVVLVPASTYGYYQPWTKSSRQTVLLAGSPAATIASALARTT